MAKNRSRLIIACVVWLLGLPTIAKLWTFIVYRNLQLPYMCLWHSVMRVLVSPDVAALVFIFIHYMNLLWDFTRLGLSHTGQELCHVVTIGPDWCWNSSQTLKFGHKLETSNVCHQGKSWPFEMCWCKLYFKGIWSCSWIINRRLRRSLNSVLGCITLFQVLLQLNGAKRQVFANSWAS